jgi:hypothetical protein
MPPARAFAQVALRFGSRLLLGARLGERVAGSALGGEAGTVAARWHLPVTHVVDLEAEARGPQPRPAVGGAAIADVLTADVRRSTY